VGLTDTLGGIFLPEFFKLFMDPSSATRSARRSPRCDLHPDGGGADLAAHGPLRGARMSRERIINAALFWG
jgi:hypothetical protein